MKQRESLWSKVDLKTLIPGMIPLIIIFIIGSIYPGQFEAMLLNAQNWLMEHFKWLYVLITIAVTAICLWLVFSKFGNIRFGGKDAKPSISNVTWFTLTLTGTIAVGICYYGVSGPVNMFMNPPEFWGVEAGSAEAIIPTLEYSFLHYGLPVYFLQLIVALILGLVYYNGKQKFKAGSTLYPLFGDKVNGKLGYFIDAIVVLTLVDCATCMGLAVIQLNSGIGTVMGLTDTPAFEAIIIVVFTIATIIFATSGVHKLMGKLSNLNAICYLVIVVFVLLCSPINRILGLLFSSLGQFVVDFVPMVTFADPVYNSSWQSNQTIYYYAWSAMSGVMMPFFYASIAYGRTLRQFIVVNCILPGCVICIWYTLFGGTAMFGLLEGSNLYEMMQQFGDGISTFAFLDTLPFGAIMKWFFLIVAVMTFITFADGFAYSFPMMFMKETSVDASNTKVPKLLTAGVGALMGVMTVVALFAGGYNALCALITVGAFPGFLLIFLILISGVKMLVQRKKYNIYLPDEEKSEVTSQNE